MYCLVAFVDLVHCSFSSLAAIGELLHVHGCILEFAVGFSCHVGVALQVPPQVVETGVGLGTDLAVVRSHP